MRTARWLPSVTLLIPVTVALVAAHPTPAPADDEVVEYRSGRYEVDAGHSTVLFKVQHVGVSNFYGRFNEVAGRYTLDAEDPTQNTVDFVVDAASVDTNSRDRDAHVKNEDFFHVDEYPTMTFKSSSCEQTEPGHFAIQGELTLLGQTRSIDLDAHLVGAGEITMFRDYRSGVEARFTIKRSEFGMTKYMGALSDEVTLIVSLEGIAGK